MSSRPGDPDDTLSTGQQGYTGQPVGSESIGGQQGYTGETGYTERRYVAEPGQPGQAGYGTQPGYGAPPGYGPQPGYGPPPGYGGGQGGGWGGGGGGGPDAAAFARRHIRTPETKEFFKTSEFFAFLLAAAGVLIAMAVLDDFDAPQAWTLVTLLTIGYMIARGLAKSGSRKAEPEPRGDYY